MKAVVQRVSSASVTVDGKIVGKIGKGLLILLGVAQDDNEDYASALASRIANLRIFEDENGKMNLSCLDVQGEALVVSQFTLFANTSRGRRPSFISAGHPSMAEPLCSYFMACLRSQGVPTETGIFGADMKVELVNDGPVTILMNQPLEEQEKRAKA